MKQHNKTMILVFSALLIAGFYQPSYAEPQNLSDVKKALITYHDSGEYKKEIEKITKAAQEYVALKVTKNNTLKKRKKLAVVLDIDETVLSNYQQMKKLNFGGSLAQIKQEEKRGNDVAIKPMRKFYNFVKQNHVALFFVTGRTENEKTLTTKNLKTEGFSGWKKLVLKPMKYKQKSAIAFKTNARKQIEKEGYTIIAAIGDQESDFKGGYTLKGFKLPNPYYYIP